MEKGSFYKYLKDGAYFYAKKCIGFIDDESKIAYSKNDDSGWGIPESRKWVATDMLTGWSIGYGSTKDQCVKNILQNPELITNLRTNNMFGNCSVDYESIKRVLAILISSRERMKRAELEKELSK